MSPCDDIRRVPDAHVHFPFVSRQPAKALKPSDGNVTAPLNAESIQSIAGVAERHNKVPSVMKTNPAITFGDALPETPACTSTQSAAVEADDGETANETNEEFPRLPTRNAALGKLSMSPLFFTDSCGGIFNQYEAPHFGFGDMRL